MCIPTRVINPGAVKAKGLFTMLSKKPTVTPQSSRPRNTKSLATFRTGHFTRQSSRGEHDGMGGRPEITSCPVVTYFTIMSMFATIVYLNIIHKPGRLNQSG